MYIGFYALRKNLLVDMAKYIFDNYLLNRKFHFTSISIIILLVVANFEINFFFKYLALSCYRVST